MKQRRSYGDGVVRPEDLASCGQGVVIEADARLFHPERIWLGDGVYVGHFAVLHGYHAGHLRIGRGCFVGQHVVLHGAGGLDIGAEVGFGAGAKVITSTHEDPGRQVPVIRGALRFAPVHIGEGSDIGLNAVVLPGVRIGRGVI